MGAKQTVLAGIVGVLLLPGCSEIRDIADASGDKDARAELRDATERYDEAVTAYLSDDIDPSDLDALRRTVEDVRRAHDEWDAAVARILGRDALKMSRNQRDALEEFRDAAGLWIVSQEMLVATVEDCYPDCTELELGVVVRVAEKAGRELLEMRQAALDAE